MKEITYVNCTNSSGSSSELVRSSSYTTMNSTIYAPTVTILNSPSTITIKDSSNNTLVSGTDYSYSSGVVTFLSTITSDLTITASSGSSGVNASTYSLRPVLEIDLTQVNATVENGTIIFH